MQDITKEVFMKSILFLIFFLTTAFAQAQDMAILLGLRNNNGDVANSLYSEKAENSFQFGGLGFFQMADKMHIRSGLIYAEKKFKGEHPSITWEGKLTYFDIPATFMYKFSDYGGVFIGPILSLNLGSECSYSTGSSCSFTDVKSMLIPFTLGASFKFAPQMGGEFYYEMISGDLANGLKDAKTVGLNFFVTFD